jgi:hypothetical protein
MSQKPFVIGVGVGVGNENQLHAALINFLKSPLCNGYITKNGRELTFNKNCDILSPNNLRGPITCCENRQEFVKKFNSELKAIFDYNRVSETERSLPLYGFRCFIKLNYRFDDYTKGSLCIEFADFQEFKKNLGITYKPDSLEFYVDLAYDFFSFSEFGELFEFDLEKKVITPKFIGNFTVDELLMIWSTITAIYVISLLQTQDVSILKDSMLKDYSIKLTYDFKADINSMASDYIFVGDMFTFLNLIDKYLNGVLSNDADLEPNSPNFVTFIRTCIQEIKKRTIVGENKPSLFRYLCSLLAISAHKAIFDYNKLIETDWSGNLNDPPDPPQFWDFSWVVSKYPALPSVSEHSTFILQPVDSSQSVVVTGGSYSRRKHRTSKKSHKIHRRHRRHRHSSHNKKHHTKRHMKRHTKRYRNRK